MASVEDGNRSTTSSEQYFMSLQPKVRFQPTDQELITHFLKRKVSGDRVPMNIIVDELQFYNYSPAQLAQMYGFANQKEMYFLVARSYFPQRKAGNGYWKQFGAIQEIKEGDEGIGLKKLLRFYVGTRKDAALTNWAMVEYTTEYFVPLNSTLTLFVLCKVYEKQAKNIPNSINSGKGSVDVTRDQRVLIDSYMKMPWQEKREGSVDVAGDQRLIDSYITMSWPEIYERETRRCLSTSPTQSPSAISCRRSYLEPCLPELPIELIIEILSWLPVECLLRFMCVCKNWCSMIQDYKFIAKHMDRVSNARISFQNRWEANSVAVVYDENFRLISCFGGLFLEKSLYSEVFRIRNFARHQVLYLPFAYDGTDTMDFVLNSFTGECKVAWFYCEAEVIKGSSTSYEEVGFKVITIGKDDQWRPLKLPNQNNKPELRKRGKHVLKVHSFGPDKVNGYAHLAEIIRDGQDLHMEIQSFDVWSECFTTTTLPRGVFSDLEKVSVIRWNNCLAVADIADEVLNVLVLEDAREHRWSEQKIRFPLNFLKGNRLSGHRIVPFKAGHDSLELHDEVRYIELYDFDNYGLKTCLLYDMRRAMVHKVSSPESFRTESYTYLKPSLVTLKGMRLKRNKVLSCL